VIDAWELVAWAQGQGQWSLGVCHTVVVEARDTRHRSRKPGGSKWEADTMGVGTLQGHSENPPPSIPLTPQDLNSAQPRESGQEVGLGCEGPSGQRKHCGEGPGTQRTNTDSPTHPAVTPGLQSHSP
jgi:hypothetical protein